MISIPLYIFLIAYIIFLVICFIFLALNFLHLKHTGTVTMASLTVSALVLGAGLLIIAATWSAIPAMDWNESLVLWGARGNDIFRGF